MSGKTKYLLVSLLTFVLLSGILVYLAQNLSFNKITMDLKVEKATAIQIFYVKEGGSLDEEHSVVRTVNESTEFKKYEFSMHDQDDMIMLRFDLGTKNNTVSIRSVTLSGFLTSETYNAKLLKQVTMPNELVYKQWIEDAALVNKVTGPDPYLLADNCETLFKNRINKYWNKTIASILALILSLIISLIIARITSKNKASDIFSFDQVTAVVFLLMICLPLIVFAMPGMQKVGTFDNRTMTPFPEFKWKQPLHWPAKFGQYFEDRFGFRNDLIVLNNNLKAKLFKTSAIPDRVRFGKEGWLFFTGENASHNYILNNNPFSDEDLEKIYQTLKQRHDWLQGMGIKYYIMIPPIKAHIYDEFLPESLKGASKINRLDQLLDYLMEKKFPIEIIDLRPVLKSKKAERLLYYKTDTHWNAFGAYFGYRELINAIHMDFPEVRAKELDEFQYIEGLKKHDGDLSQMLAIEEANRGFDTFLHPLEPSKSVRLELDRTNKKTGTFHFRKIASHIPDSVDSDSELRIVVFRDSYTNYLHKKISEHFRRSAYIWTHQFDPEEVLIEKPDIVAEIALERYIHQWIEGNPKSINE